MNKNQKMSLIYFVIIFSFMFYSCGNKRDQTNNLSTSSNPEEFVKVEMKLGKKIHKVSLNYKVNSQSKNKREFVGLKTKHLFKIGSIQDTIFYYPTFAISDNSGNIYVLDMQDCSVKKFDNKGVFIRKYGRKGKGPGEFISPFRIDVTEDGKLLVLDPNLNKCEIFDGNETKQFKLTSMPTGACFADANSFVTFQMINPFDYSALKKHSIVSDSSLDCQNLIFNNNGINLGPLAFLTGDIYRVDKNGFLYVPEFINHFVKYSSEGKIIYARNTIENLKLPSIDLDNAKMVNFRLPEEHISSWRAFVASNKLFNVSYQAMKKKDDGTDYVIDVYSLSRGDYLYSFTLSIKEKLRNLYMDNENIYLLKENLELEVLRYEIE